MIRLLVILAIASIGYAQLDQKTNKQNMVRDRGQTNVERQGSILTWSGTLIDAGCKDRSAVNLATPPESLASALPAKTAGESQAGKAPAATAGVTSHGISVDSQTLAAERGDVVSHQVPDLLTRQNDPTCAITGGTRAYAVVLDDGRLLNLDEGGNTLAADVVNSTKAGRAMLNGTAFGFKPRVKVTGRVRGDRIQVQDLGVS